MLKELARKQGFIVADGRDADKFFRVKSRAVKEAANASQQQLNALFAYNLIEADHFLEHPFYKLAKNIPELVPYLSRLRDLRNNSAHPNDCLLYTSVDDAEYEKFKKELDEVRILDIPADIDVYKRQHQSIAITQSIVDNFLIFTSPAYTIRIIHPKRVNISVHRATTDIKIICKIFHIDYLSFLQTIINK